MNDVTITLHSGALPESLQAEVDHAQHSGHDEEQEDRVQQDVLGDGDAAGVCREEDMKHISVLMTKGSQTLRCIESCYIEIHVQTQTHDGDGCF